MRHTLGMCFNSKVLVGLAAVGVAVLVLAPATALALLPLLVLAICPLSMGAMMYTMRGHGTETRTSSREAASPASLEVKRARLAALREEERRLELDLAACSDSFETPAPAATSPSAPQVAS